MKFYDCYKKMERYVFWVSILVIGSSAVVTMHKVEHLEETHEIILAQMTSDQLHHDTAVAEHKTFIQHNADQDKMIHSMIKVYREDLAQHIKEDKLVERRLHYLEEVVKAHK